MAACCYTVTVRVLMVRVLISVMVRMLIRVLMIVMGILVRMMAVMVVVVVGMMVIGNTQVFLGCSDLSASVYLPMISPTLLSQLSPPG